MYLIDSNIFLEILLARKNKEQCKELLRKIKSNEIEGICSSFAIHSIEATIERLRSLKELKVFIQTIASMEKLLIWHSLLADDLTALNIASSKKLDFGDALQYYCAKKFNCRAIISFDKHFDKLDIPRKTPEEVLKKQ